MRTVVITGGASGLGLDLARRCVRDSWTVVILDRNEAAAKAAAADVGCAHVAADVTDAIALRNAFTGIAAEYGPLDGLVNNAGLNVPGPSAELPVDDWRLVIDVNLSGTFYTCQAAYPHLRDEASIVNMGSVLGLRGTAGRAAYTAAKAGVVGMTKVLAVEWAGRGIRVNAVAPAWSETPSLDKMLRSGDVTLESLTSRIPMGRVGSPSDMSAAVAFFLSPEARFLTGQTLYVDGGYSWAG